MSAFMAFLNGFSVFLLAFSIFSVLFTKRLIKKDLSKVDRKKKEIQEILNSADQMIEELNNFSDYVITNLEEKAQDVGKLVDNLNERIKTNKEYIEKEQSILIEDNNDSLIKDQINGKTVIPFQTRNITVARPTPASRIAEHAGESGLRSPNTTSKHSQIFMLYESGMDEAEIARKLNVGRGEIQLVLGMRRGIM